MSQEPKLETQLDGAFANERRFADRVWMTQPMGGGAVRDFTWRQGMEEARRMAAHLRSLELPPGSRIAIFSKNCAWWILADLAVWMAGHVSVPIYPQLAASSIRQILEHSETRLVFIGKLDGWAGMAPGIPEGVERIGLPLSADAGARTWESIIAAAAPIEGTPRRQPDDLATIIYTSGSTGAPKGVMHSFRSMCAARVFVELFGLNEHDRMISYLPLAHVAERGLLETPGLFVGQRIFFAESLETFVADVQRARPTVFGSVPRLWLKFQSGVFEKVPPQKIERMMRIPLVRGLVKKKILAGLGLDAVRLSICGSAPVPVELLEWYARLGLRIRELYGMTENFAVSHMVPHNGGRVGTVGTVVPGCEHRLSDEGEVLVKSPGTMLGYYKAPELSRELVDEQGWIHTGDRGEIGSDGALRITGRVKELFKTSKGKYVAPAPIENLLLASPLVEQACVTGSGAPQPIALLVLAPGAKAEARETVGAALQGLCKQVNGGLDHHERLDRVVVVGEEWTVENGLLTPTLKLRRAAIEDKYGGKVGEWLEAREPVVWAG